MIISQHAQARIQQRAIPQFVIELLQDFGEISYHQGREIFHFTKASRQSIQRELGTARLPLVEKYLNTYLVTQENWLITVAYQDRHMKRNRKH